MTAAHPAQRRSPGQSMLVILGGLLGAALGRYVGLNILIPLVVAFLVGWVMGFVVTPIERPIVPAVAVQVGHLAWMLFGALLVRAFDAVLIDAVILGVGVVWLVIRPGLFPVLVLVLYQLFGLLVNGSLLLSLPIGGADHKALAVHAALRVVALVLMLSGLVGVRKARAAEEAAPLATY